MRETIRPKTQTTLTQKEKLKMPIDLRSLVDYLVCPRLAFLRGVLKCPPDRPSASGVRRAAIKALLANLYLSGRLAIPKEGSPEELAKNCLKMCIQQHGADLNASEMKKWTEELTEAAGTLMRTGEGVECDKIILNRPVSFEIHLPPDPTVCIKVVDEVDMIRVTGDQVELIDWQLEYPSEQQFASFFNFRLMFWRAAFAFNAELAGKFEGNIRLFNANFKNLQPYKRNQYAEKNPLFDKGYKKGDPKGPLLSEVEVKLGECHKLLSELAEILRAYRAEIFYRRPISWGGCKSCELVETCRSDWADPA
jgi:hypothetical protein